MPEHRADVISSRAAGRLYYDTLSLSPSYLRARNARMRDHSAASQIAGANGSNARLSLLISSCVSANFIWLNYRLMMFLWPGARPHSQTPASFLAALMSALGPCRLKAMLGGHAIVDDEAAAARRLSRLIVAPLNVAISIIISFAEAIYLHEYRHSRSYMISYHFKCSLSFKHSHCSTRASILKSGTDKPAS